MARDGRGGVTGEEKEAANEEEEGGWTTGSDASEKDGMALLSATVGCLAE